MSPENLKLLIVVVVLAIHIIAGIVAIIVAIVKGHLKEFIQEKMAEAEEKFKDLPKPQKSEAKLQYVLEAVNEKYKLAGIFLNIKKFIAAMVEFYNAMKGKN